MSYGPAQDEGVDWKEGIAWDPRLETGHEKIDAQHKELFRLTSSLVATCAKGGDAETVEGTLDFLVAYTVEHFNDEETLMLQYNYPSYAAHKKKHEDFKQSVANLVCDYGTTGNSGELAKAVNSTVVRWLTTHISMADRRLAHYVQSVQQKLS